MTHTPLVFRELIMYTISLVIAFLQFCYVSSACMNATFGVTDGKSFGAECCEHETRYWVDGLTTTIVTGVVFPCTVKEAPTMLQKVEKGSAEVLLIVIICGGSLSLIATVCVGVHSAFVHRRQQRLSQIIHYKVQQNETRVTVQTAIEGATAINEPTYLEAVTPPPTPSRRASTKLIDLSRISPAKGDMTRIAEEFVTSTMKL